MKLFLAIMFSFLLFTCAHGQTASIKPQAQGDVTFVMGGVGEEEHQALRAIQGQYNLHLTFAVKGSGEYVADVKVRIMDAKGHTVLDTQTNGPNLFVKLKPGHYKVTADRDGHVLSEELEAPSRHGVSIVFDFPVEKGD
ncbi:MAG: carboxypeptidase regulatory-like domain-containing protein [Methylomonas sp.]